MAASRSLRRRKQNLSRTAATCLAAISIFMASSQSCWATHANILDATSPTLSTNLINPSNIIPSEIPRSIYAQARMTF